MDSLQLRGRAFDAEAPRGNYADGATTGSTHRLTHRIEQLESEIVHRELLLEELIHRTKNTLQLAVAILGEHADSTSDPRIRRIVRGVQKQILILCHAHDRFYRPIDTAGRSLSRRIAGICSSIRDSFGEQASRIALALEVAEIPLQRHQEICLSLILQELLTNAFKHAFPCGREGTIEIDLGVDKLSICRLVVHDDGTGRSFRSKASTGLTLVEAFASGLQGGLAVTSDQGTTVEVWFPLS